ncbi:unnamed protein product [Citrullus colocynthis]|uniref:Uncharacterized protein n=1 Tax=Citrullus colocynthis TaxID=252529 RepID=A0ABP0XUR1_9ROSI
MFRQHVFLSISHQCPHGSPFSATRGSRVQIVGLSKCAKFDTDNQISQEAVRVCRPPPLRAPAVHRASSDAVRRSRLTSYTEELVPIHFALSLRQLSLSLAQATSATGQCLPRCSIMSSPINSPASLRLPSLVRVIVMQRPSL